MEAWVIWIIVGAIFVIAEIFSASFFAGPIGFGCIVAAILAEQEASTAVQFASFSITTVIMLLAIRPIVLKMLQNKPDEQVSGIETYVGKQGRITETVDPQSGTGRIKIGSESWRAISDKNIIIEEESLATVVRIEGSKAVVSVSENP
jgi:membrane protein implicated in regulation of membrane protease activity|tara:strand:+ start:273 stop:716 length:444 start_codon:yes stop_codon:yes gene_type:complete